MKKILSVLLCVALLLALAACGGPTNPTTQPQGTTPSTNAPTEPAGYSVAGSYKFDPGDQGGSGLSAFSAQEMQRFACLRRGTLRSYPTRNARRAFW